MPIRVDFLPASSHGLQGRVGLTFAPGKRDGSKWARDLATDLDRLRDHYHTDLLVSLLEDVEYEFLQISDLVAHATARGMRVRRFPIVDGHAPRDDEMGAFVRLIREVEEAAGAGEAVVIHCRGGLGRAGTVAASFLVVRGALPHDAIATVRVARSPDAVETLAQEAWISRVAGALRTEANGTGTRL
ncbi:MAG: cyclin-dependent kinase inhibitor 3 family protein [Chloroflexota bacterium]|jgi:protein-tyrosine phosphatase|nr:cyclin-dependent kinase inhibitor 3 family protein [Chloroflexota bacterium]NCA14217.1 protein phosphatase [Pseudomonadota bacterium]